MSSLQQVHKLHFTVALTEWMDDLECQESALSQDVWMTHHSLQKNFNK